MTPQELIAALDNFGMYSSEVMRELHGDFEQYVRRLEDAAQILGDRVDSLKREVAEERWDAFADDVFSLNTLLHGIGARDCADRARKLSQAARNQNVNYIHNDFFSLMGNMYMLDKKLVMIIPVARTGDLRKTPLNLPQVLHGSLEKLGRAIKASNAVEAMVQLANTASLSLDMELDMGLKIIKTDIDNGDFVRTRKDFEDVFRRYTERLAIGDSVPDAHDSSILCSKYHIPN